MNLAVLAPPPERLSVVVEQNAKQAPHENQSPVCHDWRDISISGTPGGDELAEPITPDILVHSNADKQATSNRLVAVNRIRRRDTG